MSKLVVSDAGKVVSLPEGKDIKWFDQLPQEIRGQAYKFWLCKNYLYGLNSPQCLVHTLLVWVNDFDLPIPKLNEILQACLHPQAAQYAKTEQLLAFMGTLADKAIREHKNEQMQRRLAESSGESGPDMAWPIGKWTQYANGAL